MLDNIQSLWIGDSLSKVEQLSIQSFLNNGHPYVLYTYSNIKNLPEGVIIEDANTIIPEEAVFVYKNGWGKGSYAGFADLFRFNLLNQNGGWWVDTDVVCLKPFIFKDDLIICSSNEGQWGSRANSCILKVPKQHEFLTYILDYINLLDIKNIGFGDIGPILVQQAVDSLKLSAHVVPYYYFNPISWSSVGDVILNDLSAKNKLKEILRPYLKPQTMEGRFIHKSSFSVHLWNEVWKQSNYDKNRDYSYSSVFEKLKRKNGIK